MWPFRKKKLYKLTWSYGSCYFEQYTDYIVARDTGEVWKKHKEEHPIATYCIELEEINRE